MKNRQISNERSKYLKKLKINKFLIILTQVLILVRFFGSMGTPCKFKGNR